MAVALDEVSILSVFRSEYSIPLIPIGYKEALGRDAATRGKSTTA